MNAPIKFRPAGVVRGCVTRLAEDGTVQVALPDGDEVAANWAVESPAVVGREALLMSDAEGLWYVTGVLGSPSEKAAVLRASAGGEARLATVEGRERIELRAPSGELVLEYEPAAGVIRLAQPSGDLELAAPRGSVRITAAGEISLVGKSVTAVARDELRLAVPARNADGPLVELSAQGIACRAQRFEFEAEETQLETARLACRTESLDAHVENGSITADSWSISARVLRETAGDVYRTAKGLVEQHCQRLRSFVREAWQVRAANVSLAAEKDFSVQAERIHLG